MFRLVSVSLARAAPRRAPVLKSSVAGSSRWFADASAGKTGVIPGVEEQAVGLEKSELEALKKGKPGVFASNQGILKGPFGTLDKPVKVPSSYSFRVVGCTGGSGDKAHELIWHGLDADKVVVCMACTQAFELEKVE